MSRMVRLTRPDCGTPWGFRMQGGRDFNAPLTIQKVIPGGLADRYGVAAGDSVLSIGGDSAGVWTHQQAQQAVIRCGNELELGLLRGSCTQPLTVSAGRSFASWTPSRQSSGSYSPAANQRSPTYNAFSPSAANQSSPSYNAFSPSIAANQSPPAYKYYPVAANQTFSLSANRAQPSYGAYTPPANQSAAAAAVRPAGVTGQARRGAAQRRTASAQSVPLCATCGSVIRGPFLFAVDKCYCPDHFYCCVCNRDLEHCGFVEEAGSLYCEDDYVRLLAPKCGGCGGTIVNESVHAMNQYFHKQCFVCAHCRQSIAGKKFRVEDNRPYCEKDWGELFFTKCAKCHEAIAPIDRFIEALGATFHAECFVCAVCGTCLEGKPFAPKDGKAYCKLHARRF